MFVEFVAIWLFRLIVLRSLSRLDLYDFCLLFYLFSFVLFVR